MTPDQRSTDHDSPWKDALDSYFPEFLALLFADVHRQIDWGQGYTFMDKELQQISADAVSGRGHTDKLIKVFSCSGDEIWVLIHVEIQGTSEADFPARMFRYHYRLRDRYNMDVVNLAVLTDTSGAFRPQTFTYSRWGCDLRFEFPMVKLMDWESRWAELEASDNLFALVVMAQLKAKRLTDGEARRQAKISLIRQMYERGYDREQILRLFTVIDWMIQLPRILEEDFLETVYAIEEEKKMPYINTAERIGMEKGEQIGLEKGEQIGFERGERRILRKQIHLKFGAIPPWANELLEGAAPEQLESWSSAILTADDLETMLR